MAKQQLATTTKESMVDNEHGIYMLGFQGVPALGPVTKIIFDSLKPQRHAKQESDLNGAWVFTVKTDGQRYNEKPILRAFVHLAETLPCSSADDRIDLARSGSLISSIMILRDRCGVSVAQQTMDALEKDDGSYLTLFKAVQDDPSSNIAWIVGVPAMGGDYPTFGYRSAHLDVEMGAVFELNEWQYLDRALATQDLDIAMDTISLMVWRILDSIRDDAMREGIVTRLMLNPRPDIPVTKNA
ncbi:MAG: hypothetical protein ACYC9J_14570 [Sulfuricaulis sp.]